MMKPMEQIGAVPQPGVNPQAAQQPQGLRDPRQEFGLTDDDLDYFRHDPEIIAVVQQVTGREFPMEQVDDALLVQIAGAVQQLGVEGTVAEASRLIPREVMVQLRGGAMKNRMPRIGGR